MADVAVSTAVPDEFAQRRRWGAFRDPSVEAAYREWHFHQVIAVGRAVGITLVVISGLLPVAFRLLFGEWIPALFIANWVIAVPVVTASLIARFAGFWRWSTRISAFAVLVVGLDIAWINGTLWGFRSPTIALGVLAMAFIPLALRLPTIETAFAVSLMVAVPVGLLIDQTRTGAISLLDSWPYFFILFAATVVIILVSAMTEAGMRQQFAAGRRLAEAHDRLGVAHRLIRRYVPEQVADAVLSDTPEAIERHKRRKLTIFFSDLVGFTDLSDELEPEDLATVLHDYFTEMSAIARKHSGTVDDLIGDAVLVLFGAPDFTDDHDHALRAVRMAVEMQEAMGPLNQQWASAGIPETLTVRMGINTGVATVGNFGSAERTKYTALGKQVNVAARIQAQCEPSKVLIGHTTWQLVRDEIPCIPKGALTLKGLHKPMPAYEVQTAPPSS